MLNIIFYFFTYSFHETNIVLIMMGVTTVSNFCKFICFMLFYFKTVMLRMLHFKSVISVQRGILTAWPWVKCSSFSALVICFSFFVLLMTRPKLPSIGVNVLKIL